LWGNDAEKFGKIYQITRRIYRQFYALKMGPVDFLRKDGFSLHSVPFKKTHFDANRRQGSTIWDVTKILGQTSEEHRNT
jgi:hypothetical protein